MELEKIVLTKAGRIWQGQELAPHPGMPTQHCWKQGKRHSWGEKKGWFNGLHWFKVCAGCKRLRLTYHSGCDVSCWGGPL